MANKETEKKSSYARMPDTESKSHGYIISLLPEYEWRRIYDPDYRANNCCALCSKSCGHCSWSSKGKPIDNWVAEPTTETRSYKIFYCPEFHEGDPIDAYGINKEGAFNLFCAMAREASLSYQSALKIIMDCRKDYYSMPSGKSAISSKYRKARSKMTLVESFFGEDLCDQIKDMVGFKENPSLDKLFSERDV